MKIFFLLITTISILFSQTYTDMLNTKVTIENNKKILCIGPGALRLLSYMGLHSQIIGVERLEKKYDLRAPYRAVFDKKELQSLPSIGQGGPGRLPSLEQIMILSPDVIFASFLSKKQLQLIQQKTNIPVVALSYGASYGGKSFQKRLESIYGSLMLIGEIMKKKSRAKELIASMKRHAHTLSLLLKKKPKAYVGAIGYKGAQGIRSTEQNYLPFALLGLESILSKGVIGHAFINEEKILEYDPDYIFFDSLGKKIIKQQVKKKKKFYHTLKAFKNQNIYWLLPYNFYNTNIENAFINAYTIASKIGTKGLKNIKKNIYEDFLGVEATQRLLLP